MSDDRSDAVEVERQESGMQDRVRAKDVRVSGSTLVIQGKKSQGAGAFKEYGAPDGKKLRVLNPDVRKEANRRANAVLNGFRES